VVSARTVAIVSDKVGVRLTALAMAVELTSIRDAFLAFWATQVPIEHDRYWQWEREGNLHVAALDAAITHYKLMPPDDVIVEAASAAPPVSETPEERLRSKVRLIRRGGGQ
jgi:hypothetical protein